MIDEHVQILRNQVLIMGLLKAMAAESAVTSADMQAARMRVERERQVTIKKLEGYRCDKGLR